MFISGLKGLIFPGLVTKDARLSLDFLVNSNIFVTLNKISVIMLQNRWKTQHKMTRFDLSIKTLLN